MRAHRPGIASVVHPEIRYCSADECGRPWPCPDSQRAAVDAESCDVCMETYPWDELFRAAGDGVVCATCRRGR